MIATAVLGPSGLIFFLVAAFALRSRNRANNQKLLVGHLADVQMHLASAQPGTPEYASLTAQAADITSALSDLPTIEADLAAAKGSGKTTGAYRAEKANEATLLIQRHRLDTWEGVQFAVPWTHMLALAALVVLLFVLPLVYVQLVYAKSSYTCTYSPAAGGCVVGPASTSLSLATA
jgi:hypothetical protein